MLLRACSRLNCLRRRRLARARGPERYPHHGVVRADDGSGTHAADDRGYPKGLQSDDIPRFARIVHVADAYDAITGARVTARLWW